MHYSNVHSPRSHADDRHGSSSATEKKKTEPGWRRFAKKRQRTVREPDPGNEKAPPGGAPEDRMNVDDD